MRDVFWRFKMPGKGSVEIPIAPFLRPVSVSFLRCQAGDEQINGVPLRTEYLVVICDTERCSMNVSDLLLDLRFRTPPAYHASRARQQPTLQSQLILQSQTRATERPVLAASSAAIAILSALIPSVTPGVTGAPSRTAAMKKSSSAE